MYANLGLGFEYKIPQSVMNKKCKITIYYLQYEIYIM